MKKNILKLKIQKKLKKLKKFKEILIATQTKSPHTLHF